VNEASFVDLIKTAVDAIETIKAMPEEERKAFLRASGPIPPNVSLGDGDRVWTTQEGLSAIYAFGRKWRAESTDRKHRISEDLITQFAEEAFGDAIAAGKLNSGTDPEAARIDLKQRLEARLVAIGRDVEHSFPCHVFYDVDVGVFDVGPVRFWPRLDWLGHVDAIGGGNTEWTSVVRTAWTATEGSTKDPLPSNWHVRDVITKFVACPWVATVTIRWSEIGRSHQRAALAVRLALDALGLVMSHSHATQLRGPGDELRTTYLVKVNQAAGEDVNVGTSVDRPYLAGPPNFAEDLIKATTPFREAAGKAIEAFIASSPVGNSPELCRRWCDALFWFGEARRDTAEFMALVRYGMTLDILTEGKQEHGITKLLSALFGVQPESNLFPGGLTLEKAVKQIYKEARSQFGHGSRTALLQDLPFSRVGADRMGCVALLRYVLCLDFYKGADRYEDFLGAVPTILPNIPK